MGRISRRWIAVSYVESRVPLWPTTPGSFESRREPLRRGSSGCL